MRELNKRDYLNILIIILSFFSIFFVLLINGKGIYGSSMDFSSQHYLVPDYFRSLFYETKDVFPSLSFNLGMGQNIYNFSYYGLFNPIILLSYLFPFVRMIDFINISSIVLLLLSIIFFYKFISGYIENKNIRLVSGLLFLLSSPIIFHTHRHIMFVSYIPFLLMGLFGVEHYINENKKFLLIISTLFIILMSYFYAIPSIIVLLLYGLFLFIRNDNSIKFKDLFFKEFKLGLILLIPVLISCFLILPTFGAIFSNRFEEKGVEMIKMFIPDFSFNNVLYSHYSLGVFSIFTFSLAYFIFSKKKEYKVLSIIFLIITFFPIVCYILNGLMYINGKVFIPFIPLAILLISVFIDELLKKEVNVNKVIITALIISVLGCIHFNFNRIIESTILFYIIDFIIVVFVIMFLVKTKNIKYVYLFLVMPIILSFIVNLSDTFENKNIIDNQYDKNIENKIVKINNEDYNIYRTVDNSSSFQNSNNIRNINEYKTTMYSSLTNKSFKEFNWYDFNRENSNRNDAIYSDSSNILYNIYTGSKYYVGDLNNHLGYKRIGNNLYKNDDVFSIGYVNNNLLSEREYNSLEYPYNIEARLNYTIVDDDMSSTYHSNLKEIKLDKTNYKITNDDVRLYNYKLDKTYTNQILIIKFNMNYTEKCNIGDTYITINGITNKLTCEGWKYHNKNYTFEYVISEKSIDNLNIEMSPGTFEISNVKAYTLDYNYVKDLNNSHDNLILDKNKTKGDIIYGKINTSGGYLSLSIPYDKGYKIYIDGEEEKVLKLNKFFIGCNISKGEHIVKIVYKAPLLDVGKRVSLIGLIIMVIVLLLDRKKRCKNEKNINDSSMF